MSPAHRACQVAIISRRSYSGRALFGGFAIVVVLSFIIRVGLESSPLRLEQGKRHQIEGLIKRSYSYKTTSLFVASLMRNLNASRARPWISSPSLSVETTSASRRSSRGPRAGTTTSVSLVARLARPRLLRARRGQLGLPLHLPPQRGRLRRQGGGPGCRGGTPGTRGGHPVMDAAERDDPGRAREPQRRRNTASSSSSGRGGRPAHDEELPRHERRGL